MSNINPKMTDLFPDKGDKIKMTENPLLNKNNQKKNDPRVYSGMSSIFSGKKTVIDNEALTKLNDNIKTIEGINDNVDVIRGNIQALMDIIDNIYALSKENNVNNNAKIEALTQRANEIASNLNAALAGLSANTTNLVETSAANVDEQETKYKTEKGETKVPGEKQITKKPIKSNVAAKIAAKAKEGKIEGGNTYKTAKKQLNNLISSMMPPTKTQKKRHHKN